MSKFDNQFDDGLVICPYCKESYQREAEDYDEDTRTEECESCGKKYEAYDSFTVTQWTKPNCGLNGDKCNLEEHENTGYGHCDICGNCERLEVPQ